MPKVSWPIIQTVKKTKWLEVLKLDLTENLQIFKCNERNLLNLRFEICAKCRHTVKYRINGKGNNNCHVLPTFSSKNLLTVPMTKSKNNERN